MSRTLPRPAVRERGTDTEIERLRRRIAALDGGDDSACERLLARACRERLAALRDDGAAG